MDSLTYKHLLSIFITIFLVAITGFYSRKKVKSASDFLSGGKKALWPIITGTIMGTLVGGAATLGTVQMAYVYGFSAWWFTLGGGLACLILALFFTSPLRKSEANTISEILTNEYGPKIGVFSSIFTSLGMFINVIAQVLSIIALLTGILGLKPFLAAIAGIIIMATYVVFGGVWGAGIVGILKTIILYITMISSGIFAYVKSGGISELKAVFPSYPWFSLFGRGFAQDMAAGSSLVIGVLSTQTYIQAIVSGRNEKEARLASFVSALLIPLIGVAGILIGFFMKKTYPNINPAVALPLFIIKHLNPWLGGMLIGALFIAIVGTGAGLTLGISTVLTKDIYQKYLNPKADNKKLLFVSRLLILAVLCSSLIFVSKNLSSLILDWSFLSMGFRGTAAFVPLITSLFFKDKFAPRAATLSVILGPISVIAAKILLPKIDPLYIGLLVSIGTIIVFSKFKKTSLSE